MTSSTRVRDDEQYRVWSGTGQCEKYGAVSSTVWCKQYGLREFRDRVVGIPYKYLVEFWVRGDWISVQRDVIRKKPREYYMYLYESCKFGRGIFVEECWFLEHSLYSIFTQNVRRDFTYTSAKEVLLT